MPKKRILYLIGSAGMGGAETFIRHTARYHDRTKFEPIYVCLRRGPLVATLESIGVKVSVPDFMPRLSRPASYLQCIGWLKDMIRAEKIDLVHSTMAYGALYGGVVAAIARVQHVWFQHGPVGGWMDVLAGLIPSDLILVNSHFTEACQRRMNLLNRKIICIPLGAESSSKVRSISQVGAIHVVMMARMQAWKGFTVFIKAVADFKKQFGVNSIKATIVSSALSQDLRDLMSDLGVTLQCLPFTEATEELFLNNDIVVNASLTPEPFGLTIVEGMMSGVVPVVAKHGGASEILQDGLDGLYFQPGSAADLAAKLGFLYQNRQRLEQISQLARQSALEKWSAKESISTLEKFTFPPPQTGYR